MKTLIVYASKHGTTEKCAKQLSKQLEGKVEVVDLKQNVNIDVSAYDKVIIGGSIYAGMLRKEVKQFCLKNIDSLKQRKVGLFVCCMRDNEQAMEQINMAFPKELLEVAVVKDYFGGEFDFSKLNAFERFIVKMVTKTDVKITNELKTSGYSSMILEGRINDFAAKLNKV